ncbi:hypothetical protein PCE1_004066 [Barthelona sp. PCE]
MSLLPNAFLFDLALVPVHPAVNESRLQQFLSEFKAEEENSDILTFIWFRQAAPRVFMFDDIVINTLWNLYCFSLEGLHSWVDEVDFLRFFCFLFAFKSNSQNGASPVRVTTGENWPSLSVGSPMSSSSTVFDRDALLKKRCSFLDTSLSSLYTMLGDDFSPDLLNVFVYSPTGSPVETILEAEELFYTQENKDEFHCNVIDLIDTTSSHVNIMRRCNLIKKVEVLETNELQHCVLSNCTGSNVYIQGRCNAVILTEVSKCTVYVPASTFIYLNHCKNVKIVGTTRVLRLHSCFNCVVNVHTSQMAPLITGRTQNTVFGPFHLAKAPTSLGTMMLSHGISTRRDSAEPLWKKPIVLKDIMSNFESYTIMPAAEHTPFVLPLIGADEEVTMTPVKVPNEYLLALEEKKTVFDITRETIAELPPQDQIQLEQALKGQFLSWMMKNDSFNSVANFLNMEE